HGGHHRGDPTGPRSRLRARQGVSPRRPTSIVVVHRLASASRAFASRRHVRGAFLTEDSTMRARSVPFAALLGLGSLVSCQYEATNPSHCVYNGGDPYCRRLFPDLQRPYCVRSFCDELHAAAEYGCIAERPDPPSCWSQCGADSVPTADGLSCVGGPSMFGEDSESATSTSTTLTAMDA